MKNKLEKTVLSAIAGLTLLASTGCSTLKEKVWDYQGPSGPAIQDQERLENYKFINGSSYRLFPNNKY